MRGIDSRSDAPAAFTVAGQVQRECAARELLRATGRGAGTAVTWRGFGEKLLQVGAHGAKVAETRSAPLQRLRDGVEGCDNGEHGSGEQQRIERGHEHDAEHLAHDCPDAVSVRVHSRPRFTWS